MKSYKDFINSMPTIDHPEAFGQNSNADVASQIHESKIFVQTLLTLLPQKSSTNNEKQNENDVKTIAKEMIKMMPKFLENETIKNDSPISIVLRQEVRRVFF